MFPIIVISLIVLGVFLILIEFFVLPGITISGIGGILFIISGVGVSYRYIGHFAGTITLISSILVLIILLIIALKSKTWNKIMLKSSIKSTSPKFNVDNIRIGDTGITISRLAPMGKILINDMYVEAKSLGGFIKQEEKVVIVKVLTNKVIVKLDDINTAN